MAAVGREFERNNSENHSPESFAVRPVGVIDAFEKTEEIINWLKKKDSFLDVVVATPDSSSFASFVAVSLYEDFAVFPLNMSDGEIEISSENVSPSEAIDPVAAEDLHYLLDNRNILVFLMGNTTGHLKTMIGEYLQNEYHPEKCSFVAIYESPQVQTKVDFAAGLTEGFPILETRGESK